MGSIAFPEIRAFEVLDHVPDGCRLVPICDDRNDPHLRQGEFAVVDTTDTAFAHGELFLVDFGSRADIMQVTWPRPDEGIWFRPLKRSRSPQEFVARCREGREIHLSEGPLKPECLPDYLMGRVIGIYQGPEIQ